MSALAMPGSDVRLRPQPSSWLYDAGMALVLGCLLAVPISSDGGPAFATSVLLTCALVPRSNLPRVSLAIGTAACILQVLLVDTPTPSIMIVPLIIYSVARWSTQQTARVTLAIGVFGSILGPTRWLFQRGTTDLAFPLIIASFGCMGMVAAAYALGRRRRDSVLAREQRQEAEIERARHQVAERNQQTRIAAVSERQRIARELHDIVAHSLSVIVVQAEGGTAIAAKRPEIAPQVLETIAKTSREALVEMRRIVSLLRGNESAAEDTFVPSPGLDDLAVLVRKTGNALLTVRGALPSVSPALGLTVYRVVQESLTNVLKHGGTDAKAAVVLTTYPDRLEVLVTDDGNGDATLSDGQGNGLRGMRERVAVHGGILQARPMVGGGFAVHMVIPLECGFGPRGSSGQRLGDERLGA